MAKLAEAYVELVARTASLDRSLQMAMQRLSRLEDAGKKTSTKLSASLNGVSFGGLIGGVTSAIGAYGLLTTAVQAATGAMVAGVRAAADWQSMSTTLTVLTGSAEIASRIMRDMEAFAAKTPLTTSQLVKSVQGLKSFGFGDVQAMELTKSISNVAAARPQEMGLTMDRLSRVFGQVQAKGRLMGEELLQLTEAGVNGGQAIADALGVDVASALKLVEKGAVDAKTAISAIKAAIDKQFGGLAEATSKTFDGAMSTLLDSTERAGRKAMGPATSAMTEFALAAADALAADDLQPQWERLALTIEQAVEPLRWLASADGISGLIGTAQRFAQVLALPASLAAEIGEIKRMLGMSGGSAMEPSSLLSFEERLFDWNGDLARTRAQEQADASWQPTNQDGTAAQWRFADPMAQKERERLTKEHMAWRKQIEDRNKADALAEAQARQDAARAAEEYAKLQQAELTREAQGAADLDERKRMAAWVREQSPEAFARGKAMRDALPADEQVTDLGGAADVWRRAIGEQMEADLAKVQERSQGFAPSTYGDAASRFAALQTAALTNDPSKKVAEESEKIRKLAEEQLRRLDRMLAQGKESIRFAAP